MEPTACLPPGLLASRRCAKCDAAQNLVLRDGLCEACLPTYVAVDNMCVCPPNQAVVGELCTPCLANEVVVEGVCTPCGTNYVANVDTDVCECPDYFEEVLSGVPDDLVETCECLGTNVLHFGACLLACPDNFETITGTPGTPNTCDCQSPNIPVGTTCTLPPPPEV